MKCGEGLTAVLPGHDHATRTPHDAQTAKSIAAAEPATIQHCPSLSDIGRARATIQYQTGLGGAHTAPSIPRELANKAHLRRHWGGGVCLLGEKDESAVIPVILLPTTGCVVIRSVGQYQQRSRP